MLTFKKYTKLTEGSLGYKYTGRDACFDCNGSGYDPQGNRNKEDVPPCKTCKGTGKLLKEAVDTKLIAQSTKDLYRHMGEPYEVIEYVFGKAANNPNASNNREVQVFLKALALKVNSALQKKDDLGKHVTTAYKAGETWGQTGKLTEAAKPTLRSFKNDCPACSGSGYNPNNYGDDDKTACKNCKGTGEVNVKLAMDRDKPSTYDKFRKTV